MQDQSVIYVAFIPTGNVKYMYCPACKIHTNHHRIKGDGGRWVCWCSEIVEENKPEEKKEL